LIKPKKARSPKKLNPLKIKLKIDSNPVKEEPLKSIEESVDLHESNDDEQLNTTVDTIVSNAVDVVNIDDDDDRFSRTTEQNEGKANKKRLRTSLTEEQIHSITDIINAVAGADDAINNNEHTVDRPSIETQDEKKKKKQKLDFDVYNFQADDEGKSVKKNKKDKKSKKKHKNRDASPSNPADADTSSKKKKRSKKHRNRNSPTAVDIDANHPEIQQHDLKHPVQPTTSVLHDSIALSTLLSSMPVVITTPQKNQASSSQIMSVTSEIYVEVIDQAKFI
jgi:hypothetical protein